MTEYQSQIDKVLMWIKDERSYQAAKFDYGKDDIEHIQQGVGEDSWIWQQVLNYLGRVNLFTMEMPHGRQAFMKIVTTLVGMAEAMINVYGELPAPGVSSGNVDDWHLSRRVYVAGPMTGIENKNFPAFREATERLNSMGWIAVNPARNEGAGQLSWEDYMRLDIQDMLTCEAVFCLPGWENSRGASMEVEIARNLNIPVYTSWEDVQVEAG